MERRLQRLFELARVPTGHAHRLRDTFAVELLLAGVPLDRSLSPQSRAARDPFGRVPEPEFRSCQTTSITPRKGERKDTDQSTRKTTQDGTCPGSWWGGHRRRRGGMLNSAMILFPVAPLHCRDGAIRFLKLTSVTAIRPDKRQIALPPRFI